MNKKSYSQRKREKLDYRNEYFKHNPGLFGCIWTCAYCHKPLVGKQHVQVDHIIPLNNVLGRNARFNLVAACERCNKQKSDKADARIVEGYISKIIESVIFTIQKIIIVCVVALWVLIQKIASLIAFIITRPFCGTSITIKLLVIFVYAAIIYLVYSSIT